MFPFELKEHGFDGDSCIISDILLNTLKDGNSPRSLKIEDNLFCFSKAEQVNKTVCFHPDLNDIHRTTFSRHTNLCVLLSSGCKRTTLGTFRFESTWTSFTSTTVVVFPSDVITIVLGS